MPDWAGIHHDVLFEIAKRVTSIESYESFGAVCRSWRAVTTKDKENLKHKTFETPWFVRAEKESSMIEFFSVLTGKTRKIFLPEASKKHCLLYRDWLFMVAEDKIHASLLHLVSRVQIHLPKLDTLMENGTVYIHNFVLSADPSSTSDFIVMVLWGWRYQLVFCKPGDTSWTAIENWDHSQFYRIIYFNNKLYAVNQHKRVVRCDVHGPHPTQLHHIFSLPQLPNYILYMVEFSRKLLIVRRYAYGQYEKTEFKVYEVNVENGKTVEMKDLGNNAIFLSSNYSLLVECSEINNFKPNCIYFSTSEYSNQRGTYHL